MKTINMRALSGKPYNEIERALTAFLFPNDSTTLSSQAINEVIDQGTTVHFEMREDMGGHKHKYMFISISSMRIRFEYLRRGR